MPALTSAKTRDSATCSGSREAAVRRRLARRSIIAGSRDCRLSLMRRLASLRRDSRCRRASFSLHRSLPYFVPTTSVPVRAARVLPAHRGPPADCSGFAANYTGEHWWEIGGQNTDILLTLHNILWHNAPRISSRRRLGKLRGAFEWWLFERAAGERAMNDTKEWHIGEPAS